MGKAKRFNSYDDDVAAKRSLVQSYGQARQNLSGIGSSFRSSPMSPVTSSSNPDAFSSGADNLGNHTATKNLNMAGFDITSFDDIIGAVGDKYGFDGNNPPNTYITGSSTTTGRINVFNSNTNVTSFLTTGILTTNIDINGNTLTLDADADTSIDSSTDDSVRIITGGSARLTISNTGTTISNNIAGLGNFQVTGTTVLSSTLGVVGNAQFDGNVEINGALNHDGTTVGFYGKTPQTRAIISKATSGDSLAVLIARFNILLGVLGNSSNGVQLINDV
jgi:hypothetical protein